MSKPAKTINERYTKKQRKEIAESLRGIDWLECNLWGYFLPFHAADYVKRVLQQYKVTSFNWYLEQNRLNMDNYPLGGWSGYIHDALNKLADELDPPKEPSK